MLIRITILLAIALACGYGIKQLLGGFKRKYFIVALCGMAALFFSRLYYLIIVFSDGNDEVLTVGTLGQAAAYLFFTTANISFLPREGSEKLKKVCIPGAVGAAAAAGFFILSAVRIGTVSAYIGEFILMCTICSTIYISAANVSYRRENTACDAVCPFNICVCVLAALNAFSEFVTTMPSGTAAAVIMWVSTVMSAITALLMLPLLRRRDEKWPQ